MASAKKYTDEQRAEVFSALQIYEGNVKRTARSTGVPEQTVRDWKKAWEKTPPSVEIQEISEEVVDNFRENAVRLRDKAMALAEIKIESGEAKLGELNAMIGTLQDKINLIDGRPTSRSETTPTATDPEALGKALMGFVRGALEAAHDRAVDIEIVELAEIPPQTEN